MAIPETPIPEAQIVPADFETSTLNHDSQEQLRSGTGEKSPNLPAGNTTDNEDSVNKDLEQGDSDREPEPAPAKDEKDPNLVDWDGPDDPEKPQNWPASKRWMYTVTLGLMTFCVTFASSVFSTATIPTAALFHVSTEVTTLGTSLFVAGFAVGPLVSTCALNADRP